MSGSKSTNSEAVNFEKEQAAKADAKEQQRQARLDQGKTLIDQIFNGAPILKDVTQNFDWSSIAAPKGTPAQVAAIQSGAVSPFGGNPAALTGSALPTGYAWVQTDAPVTNTAADAVSRARAGAPSTPLRAGLTPDPSHPGYARAANANVYTGGDSGKDAAGLVWTGSGGSPGGAATGAPGQVWAIKGPDGKIHYQGDQFSYQTQQDTGQRAGGFNDDFYDQYGQKYLDLYQPEEQRSYDMAKRDLGFNLARAGLSKSSVAADKQGELAYQDALQKAKIVSDASVAKADLRKQVDAQKQQVLNQLYATEDPTLAANLAQSSAKGTQLQNPTLTPGMAFFDPLLSAVGGYLSNATSPYNQSNRGGPSVASASGTNSTRGYS